MPFNSNKENYLKHLYPIFCGVNFGLLCYTYSLFNRSEHISCILLLFASSLVALYYFIVQSISVVIRRNLIVIILFLLITSSITYFYFANNPLGFILCAAIIILYNSRLFTLRKIPLLKNLCVAFLWAYLPIIIQDKSSNHTLHYKLFSMSFILILFISIAFDKMDSETDLAESHYTFANSINKSTLYTSLVLLYGYYLYLMADFKHGTFFNNPLLLFLQFAMLFNLIMQLRRSNSKVIFQRYSLDFSICLHCLSLLC